MSKSIESKATLNNGVEIPFLGLGVYMINSGAETENAVRWALEAGYRHIDTAQLYGNERDVGRAVHKSDIPREEIFLTTKVWNANQGYDKTIRSLQESLKKFEFDYLDLFLIHWPVQNVRNDTWKAMTTLLEEGTCRAIGVSNYTIRHLKELLNESSVAPTINQVEFNPFLFQKDLLEFCRSNDIQLEAYTPLTRGRRLNDKTLLMIAEKNHKTSAQILIRWALQHDIVVIPKSANKDRIYENSDVFDFNISDDDIRTLDSLKENYRVCWNPTNVT